MSLGFSLKKCLPLVAALVFVASVPAVAQEEEPNELQKLFGAVGLLDLPKDPIDYSERSPLVVPPSADLPKPGEAADVRRLNPEWPVDQDVKNKKAAAKESRKPIDMRNDTFYGGRVMKQSDWKGGATSKNGTGEVMTEAEKQGNWRISLDKLGFKGWDKKDTTVKFEGEPERTSLLQPPPGYQTPSKNAPYGIVEDEKAGDPIWKKDRFDDRNKR